MLSKSKIKAAHLLVMYDNQMTREEIARECDTSRTTLWKWETQDKEFQDYIQQQIMPSIRAAAPSALRQMVYLSSRANQDSVKFSASKYILETAGYKAVDKVETTDHTQLELIKEVNELAKKQW